MNRRGAILSALICIACWPVSTSDAMAIAVTPQTVLIPLYALYSLAVDRYATGKVNLMKEVQLQKSGDDDDVAFSPSQLRTTVSKWNHLVTRPEDRMKWNQWLLTTTAASSASDLSSFCNDNAYQFMYRSYANFEEVGALCKPFWTWRRLGLMFRKYGVMEFSKDPFSGNGEKDDKSDPNALAFVSNAEWFRLLLILPVDIQWWGKVVMNKDNDISKYRIVWTHTELRMPLGFKQIVVKNPKTAVELSAIPWDIVKSEDGFVGFRRGDIGYLTYDAKK